MLYSILRIPVILFLKIKFGYKFTVAKNLPEKYIVLSNHTTEFDPLFVGASFPRQMYFVASEHIARWKFVYKLLQYILAPIIRYKGTVGASTVVDVLRKVKAGSNVCIFAEGNRCWDGVTGPILPSTGKLIKSAKCGLVTYKLTGGYFVSPRWSVGGTRRGHISGAPVGVYSREELEAMTVDEINALICRDLHEDAYATQSLTPKKYRSKISAEQMENLLFICPECGALDSFHSHRDQVACEACGFSFRYNEFGMLENCSFKTVQELSDWQKTELANRDHTTLKLTSPNGTLISISNHVETLVSAGAVTMSNENLCCGDYTVPLASIADMAIHGRRGIVFTAEGTYYELLPDAGSNALKYVLFYETMQHAKECVRA